MVLSLLANQQQPLTLYLNDFPIISEDTVAGFKLERYMARDGEHRCRQRKFSDGIG